MGCGHCVGLVKTDVSEECMASNFRVEKSISEESVSHRLLTHRQQSVSKWLTLSLFVDFSTLKMEETRSSEMSVLTRPKRRHITEAICQRLWLFANISVVHYRKCLTISLM
jgi:hypothetical protein